MHVHNARVCKELSAELSPSCAPLAESSSAGLVTSVYVSLYLCHRVETCGDRGGTRRQSACARAALITHGFSEWVLSTDEGRLRGDRNGVTATLSALDSKRQIVIIAFVLGDEKSSDNYKYLFGVCRKNPTFERYLEERSRTIFTGWSQRCSPRSGHRGA